MAAILQFRQGSKASFISSGPYISEPFFDTDTNIIHIGVSGSSSITLTKLEDINSGSFSVSGDISGSNLYLSGDITASNTLLSGDITIGGNIILGDQVQDNITISGQFDSNLIPSASATYDLGSTTKKWNHLYAVSASIDSVDLVANLPSGVVSSSLQLTGNFDYYGGFTLDATWGTSQFVGSSETVYLRGNPTTDDIRTTISTFGSTNYIDFQINTGSAHFTNAVSEVGAPQGTVSGSQQVIDLLPSGVVSGSSQVQITQLSQIDDTLFLEGTETWSSTDSLLITPFAVDKRFDTKGVISGSSQVEITQLSQINDTLFLQGTEVWSSTDSLLITPFAVDKRLDSKGLISGSSQITPLLPTGVVSGSSQISELSHLHSFTSSFDTAISLNSSDVTILGNLTVQGTQTQLNTSTLNVEDLNILLASGSTTSAEADGAGITIDGANKSLQWEHSTTQFVFDAQVSSSVGFKGDGSNLTGLTADSVEYINILNKPTLISGSVQVLGGTNIVSSSNQVINFLPDGVVSGSTQILGGTNIVSSSTQVTNFLPDGTISGSTQIIEVLETQTPGLVSGSDQVTSSLDTRYASLGGDNLLSSSNENFTEYSQSVDIRLSDGFESGSLTSQSLHTLVGHFPTSGGLGTAAFYNVSSSLADDPSVIPNVKAVYDYINNTIGAADITGVSASLGLSGGGLSGYVSLSLDTGSTHFQQGVELYSSTLPDGVISGSSQVDVTATTNYSSINQYSDTKVKTKLNSDGVISGSSQVTITESQISNLQSYLLRAPDGTVSGSSQTIDHIKASTLVAINQTSPSSLGTNGEFIINGTTNGYSGILTLESGSVKVYNQYATESDKMINFLGGSGYGLYLQPDNTSTKAWVIDTDGDFVSQGTGDVYAENVYATGQFSGSQLFLASDGTVGTNFSVGGNLDVSGTIFGALSGSSQVDVTATTNYSSINQYTDSDNTTHLNSLGVVSGSSQLTSSLDTRYASIAGNQTYTGNKTFSNNVTISGDLNVAGTTTYTSTNNVNIGDNILELNFGGSATTGGILVKDATGTTTSGSLIWDSSTDNWKAGALGSESPIVRTTDLDYYTDSDNTSHLNSLGVISGSSQVSLGGDLSGTANSATVEKVQGISLTSDEATQLANINSVTISNTQWGYLGGLNQALTTTSDALFNKVQSNNPDLTHGGQVAINSSYNGSGWGTNKGIGRITFGTLDNDSSRIVGTIEVKQEDNGSTYPDETYMVFKTTAAADVNAQEKMRLSADGNLSVSGDVVAYSSSDRRLKDEIIPISNPLDKINSIGGYSFVWNNEKQNIYSGKDYGVIAQEIEEILPELVTTRENGYKAVKYDKIISLLIEGIKELSTEVKELKEKINRE